MALQLTERCDITSNSSLADLEPGAALHHSSPQNVNVDKYLVSGDVLLKCVACMAKTVVSYSSRAATDVPSAVTAEMQRKGIRSDIIETVWRIV